VFFWPIWARAHATEEAERLRFASRYATEILRLSLYGTMRAEAFPEIVERLRGGKK